jgi:acyl-CoA hydrolase
MLTEREIRLITLYADMIQDEAMGLAAQQAVSEHGANADRGNSAIHTVLRELRQEGYR